MMTLLHRYELCLGRKSQLRLLALLFSISSILQGITIILLVPLLRSLMLEGFGSSSRWFLAVGLTGAASLIVHFFTSLHAYKVCMDDMLDLTARSGNRIVDLPLGWFRADSATKVSHATLNAPSGLSHLPVIVLPQIVINVVTPVVILIGMYIYEWRMAVVLTIAIPIYYLLQRWINRVSTRAFAIEGASDEEISRRVLEFGALQSVFRAAGGDRGMDRVRAAIDKNNQAMLDGLKNRSAPVLSAMLFIQGTLVVATAVGLYLLLHGELDIATFTALALFCVRFAQPLSLLPPYLSELTEVKAHIETIASIVVDAPSVPEPEPSKRAKAKDNSIDVEHVSFGYGPKNRVLNDVSLHLPGNTVTALVGPSGCGKSTLLRLIARFHDVNEGAVRIGGADVRDLGTDQVMEMTSMVFQDVYLFEGSIKENVRLGLPDATDEQLAEAARRARLDEVIERLPGGWDAEVGEGGRRLSGGERQRVAIARAFLKDAPVLLLDEVTASLDGANEAAVTAAIHELSAGRTTVLIAHRLSTVTRADKIVVFNEHGRIDDEGTHQELAARSGIYARFLADHEAGENWRLDEVESHS